MTRNQKLRDSILLQLYNQGSDDKIPLSEICKAIDESSQQLVLEVLDYLEDRGLVQSTGIDRHHALYWITYEGRQIVGEFRRSEKVESHITTQSMAFTRPTPPLSTSSSSSTLNTQLDSILIVTVTKVEAQAVLTVFSQTADTKWSRQVIGKKTYYSLGVHGGVPVFMVQSEMGIATSGGALLTVRQAIQDLHPRAVIMCGIAFGFYPDEQQLGDILVAKQIQYYEPHKVDKKRGQIPRGDRAASADLLLDRFRSGDLDWQGAPRHFGLVLSGEKLVNDPIYRNRLLEIEPEAIGGEMEGAGLYAAAHDAKVDWILVKAICDWADGKKNDEAHQLAARNAAQFVLYVLQLGGWSEIEQLPEDKVNVDIPQELDRPEPSLVDLAKKVAKPQLIISVLLYLDKQAPGEKVPLTELCIELGISSREPISQVLDELHGKDLIRVTALGRSAMLCEITYTGRLMVENFQDV